MKIYYFSNANLEKPMDNLLYEKLDAYFQTKKHIGLYTNLGQYEKPMIEEHDLIFPDMDACIVEHSSPNQALACFIAYTLAVRIPVLYLLLQYSPMNPYSQCLLTFARTHAWLEVKYYSLEQIPKLLDTFLKRINSMGADRAIIKFTLRLSLPVLDYLDWKSKYNKKQRPHGSEKH